MDQYNQSRIETIKNHSTELFINNLQSFVYYTFTIYAINQFGSSPKSKPLTLQTLEDGK